MASSSPSPRASGCTGKPVTTLSARKSGVCSSRAVGPRHPRSKGSRIRGPPIDACPRALQRLQESRLNQQAPRASAFDLLSGFGLRVSDLSGVQEPTKLTRREPRRWCRGAHRGWSPRVWAQRPGGFRRLPRKAPRGTGRGRPRTIARKSAPGQQVCAAHARPGVPARRIRPSARTCGRTRPRYGQPGPINAAAANAETGR